MVDDLKIRIKKLLRGDEIRQLEQAWIKRLTEVGVNERDAHRWVAEINHVLDAYEMSLRPLIELFQEADQEHILVDTQGWASFTHDIIIFKMEDATSHMLESVNEYVPPDPDDEDE
jgi:hypothetical protein